MKSNNNPLTPDGATLNFGSFFSPPATAHWGDNANLTKEQVEFMMKRYAANYTLESSKSIEKTLKAKIDGTDIGDMMRNPSTEGSGQQKFVSSEEIGRQLFEKTVQLVQDCGKVFYHVVVTNYNVSDCILDRSQELTQMNVRNQEIEEGINAISSSVHPEEYFNAKRSIEEAEKTKILKAFHFAHWLLTTGTAKEKKPIGDVTVVENLTKEVEAIGPEFKARTGWTIVDIVDRDIRFDIPPSWRQLTQIAMRFETVFRQTNQYYNDYDPELSILKEELNQKYQMQYIEAYENKLRNQRQIIGLKEEQTKLKRETETTSVLTHINIAFSTAITLLTGKIKLAVRGHQEIISKLQSTVQLKNNGDYPGDVVANPFDSSNLAGMIENLRSAYVEANIVTFKNKFMEVLNFRLPKEKEEDPLYGVQIISQRLHMWQSMKLFQYLTEDIFWTVCFLRQYSPESEIYKEALKISMNYIHQIHVEKKDIPNNQTLLYSGMPVFSHIMTWLHSVYSPTLDFTNGKRRGGGFQRGKFQRQNSETGFAANDSTVLAGMNLAEPTYNREVTRKDNVYVMDANGKRQMYTATAVKCPDCATVKKHTFPQCYLGCCSACNMYGHKSNQCRQRQASSSNKEKKASV